MNSTIANYPWLRYWMFLGCLAGLVPQAQASDIANSDAPKEFASDPTQASVTPYKSPNTALLLSLGITTLSAAVYSYGFWSPNFSKGREAVEIIAGLGLAIGPSAGLYYSGEAIRATLTSLARGATLVATTIGVVLTMYSDDSDVSGPGILLMSGGGLAFLGLTLWDIIDAPFSAKRFNEKAAKQHLALTPLIIPSQDSAKSSSNFYGLSLSGSF